MGKVLIADNADFRAVAIAAGATDPHEVQYIAEEGALEVPGVSDAALVTARDDVADGTATATADAKARKIKELKDAETAATEHGFQSNPKGTGAVWFDSSLEDQVNLIGNILAGGNTVHSNRPTQGGEKDYEAYTNAELLQVLKDGRSVKLANRQNLAAKLAAVETAITLSDLREITF